MISKTNERNTLAADACGDYQRRTSSQEPVRLTGDDWIIAASDFAF
jgi:hypothetical protein